jgi:CBS-domain-containing membrane protein
MKIARSADVDVFQKSNGQWSIPILSSASAASAVGAIGILSVLCHAPWLFASLGPTIVIQCGSPQERIARPWNVAIGHLVALATAFLAIHLTGAAVMPPFADHAVLTINRVVAAAFAVGVGFYLEVLLGARHPPAASTALLVTLGIVKADWRTVAIVVIGVSMVVAIGEPFRHALLKLRARAKWR